MHHYPVTPAGMRVNNQTIIWNYHITENIYGLDVMPVIQSKCFNDTFWVLLKAHFTREGFICCALFGRLKICHLLSLNRVWPLSFDLSAKLAICFSSEPSECRGRFISPFRAGADGVEPCTSSYSGRKGKCCCILVLEDVIVSLVHVAKAGSVTILSLEA